MLTGCLGMRWRLDTLERSTIGLEVGALSHIISAQSLGRGGAWSLGYSTMPTQWSLIENWTLKFCWTSWLAELFIISQCQEGTKVLRRTEALFWSPPRLRPMRLSQLVSFCNNKTVIIITVPSWVLWVFLEHYWTWENLGGSPSL